MIKFSPLIIILVCTLSVRSQDSAAIRFQKTIDSLREIIISDTGKYSLPQDYPAPLFIISNTNGRKGFTYQYGLHIPGKLTQEFVNEFLNNLMGAKINSIIFLKGSTSAAIYGPEGRWNTYIFILKKDALIKPYVAGFIMSKRNKVKKLTFKQGDNLAIQKAYFRAGRIR